MNHRARCPVCYQPVSPTLHHNICGHLDATHKPCPASYRPFTIAIIEPHTPDTTQKP